MRRALALAVLLLSSRVYAGVALLDTVSSCPSVIKNVITVEMLLSDGFEPWDVTVGIVDTVNIVDTVDNIDSIDIDNINIVDDIDTVDIVDNADNLAVIVTDRPEPPTAKRKIKFGRRAAFNHSWVSNFSVRIYTHDGESFSYAEYRNRVGFGVGFEVAGIIDVVLADALSLNLSPGFVVQKPISTAAAGTSEAGLFVPLMFEWAPFGGGFGVGRGEGVAAPDVFAKSGLGRLERRHLRLFGGIWAGAPLYVRVKWIGEGGAPFKERSAADFGLICGAGVYVSEWAYIDIRGVFGLSEYDITRGGHRLSQLAIGVNYVK
jgi:hypothetical protein